MDAPSDPIALLAIALEEAARFQVKFAHRDDPELQSLRKERWTAVGKAIQALIADQTVIKRRPAPKKVA